MVLPFGADRSSPLLNLNAKPVWNVTGYNRSIEAADARPAANAGPPSGPPREAAVTSAYVFNPGDAECTTILVDVIQGRGA
jgi:hypothetical protein